MNFSLAKEMRPYLEQPRAMPVGTPGKSGYLYLGFELDRQGKSIMRDWERHAPLIVQQELYFDEGMPEMPCVYILSSGGPNVDGDRYEQHFVVRRGAYAHLSTGAATKLAEMRYNYSGLRQTFELEQDAYMEFLPEPTIPCRHTRFISDTSIRIDPTATLFYAELFMSGRKYFGGERFAYDVLSVCTRAERPDAEPLFREKFVVRPADHSPRTLGAMDDYDVLRQRGGAHPARTCRADLCADGGLHRPPAPHGGGHHAASGRVRAALQGRGRRNGAREKMRPAILLRSALPGQGTTAARGVSVALNGFCNIKNF